MRLYEMFEESQVDHVFNGVAEDVITVLSQELENMPYKKGYEGTQYDTKENAILAFGEAVGVLMSKVEKASKKRVGLLEREVQKVE